MAWPKWSSRAALHVQRRLPAECNDYAVLFWFLLLRTYLFLSARAIPSRPLDQDDPERGEAMVSLTVASPQAVICVCQIGGKRNRFEGRGALP